MKKRLWIFNFVLALAGIVVTAIALQIHYAASSPLSIGGAGGSDAIVNHSGYAAIGVVPVAVIGVVGYVIIALLAFFRQRWWTVLVSWVGLGFAAYLSYVEMYNLHAWSLYWILSLIFIALIAIFAISDAVLAIFEVATGGIDRTINNLRYG